MTLPLGVKRRLLLPLLVALLLPVTTEAAARVRYQDGEKIQFSGYVTDPSGAPMSDITVVLEVSRHKFDLLTMRRVQQDVLRLSTVTNESGEYQLEWGWNDYYNRLELAAGVPVRKGDGESLRVLSRLEITQRTRRGSPVVTPIVIEQASFVTKLRAFLASIESGDQRQVYEQVGAPDKSEQVDRGGDREVAWWYFELGKVYRFRNGSLEKVEPFEPVKRF